MLKLKSFSRLKNIFSRLNPMPSFKWENGDGEMIVHPSSKELLEKVINKYPEFKNVILIQCPEILPDWQRVQGHKV